MKRYSCSVVCLTIIMITSTAWGQSTSLDTTGASTVTGASTNTSSQPASDLRQAIRHELLSSLAQVFVDMIHNFFSDLRAFVGLPAVPTDPATDPLAILESIFENVVNEKGVNDSAGQ